MPISASCQKEATLKSSKTCMERWGVLELTYQFEL